MLAAACQAGSAAALRAAALAGALGAALIALPRAAAELPLCGPEAAYHVAARGLAVPLPRGGWVGEDHLDWTYVFPAGESQIERAVAILNQALAARDMQPVTMAEITILAPRAATAPCRPRDPAVDGIAQVLTGDSEAASSQLGEASR